MTTELQVALVGYGFVGQTFHAPLIAAVDGLRLHSVVSRSAGLVRAAYPDVQVHADLETALRDPAVDLVVIATPNVLHAEQAREALTAGKHVVVDKPFTVTPHEAREVIAHAQRAERVLSVFHNRRWDSDFLTLRSLLTTGVLGEITQFESHFDRFRPEVRDRWREREGAGSGLWYDLGPHLVDQALQLFGAPIAVSADIGMQRQGAQSDDYFHVQLRYARLRVLLHASTLVVANDRRFAVHGTRGSFLKDGLDPQEAALKAGHTPGGAGWGSDSRSATLTINVGDVTESRQVSAIPGDYRRFYAGLRDAILGAGINPVPATDALMVMELIEAGRQSAAERREVTVTR
jgi:predicted dehydrogenase